MSMPATTPASLRLSALGRRVHAPTIARLMTLALENPRLLSLAAGFTDNGSLPVDVVAEVAARLARSGEPEFLQYGSNAGRPGLRRLLAERFCAQDGAHTPAEVTEQCLITNGSQQGLYLAMQVLCDPGDIVLVDRPSYFVYLEMLAGLGVEARSIPVDAQGRIDAVGLTELIRTMRRTGDLSRVKAVYFVSYFSNPSGRTLTREEKNAVADVLATEGVVVPVLEDAAYRELYFEQPPAAPSVFALPAWQEFPKLYLSTLTKPFASGLKVGYAFCSDANWRARMLYVKGHHDFGTANFNQAVCERVVAEEHFDAHLVVLRRRYAAKMAALHETLEGEGLRELGWRWEQPAGGLYLWLEAPRGLETGLEGAFCHACIEEGVLYVPGELCFGDQPPTRDVRLSFGVLAEPELQEAGRRFVRVARRFAR